MFIDLYRCTFSEFPKSLFGVTIYYLLKHHHIRLENIGTTKSLLITILVVEYYSLVLVDGFNE